MKPLNRNAVEHANYALDVAQEIGSPRGIAQSGVTLGQIYKVTERPDEAVRAYQLAATAARKDDMLSALERAEESFAKLRLGER